MTEPLIPVEEEKQIPSSSCSVGLKPQLLSLLSPATFPPREQQKLQSCGIAPCQGVRSGALQTHLTGADVSRSLGCIALGRVSPQCSPDGKSPSPGFGGVGAWHSASRRAGPRCSSVLLGLFLAVILQPPSPVAQLLPSLQNPHFCDHRDLLLASPWEVPLTCTPAASPALRKFYGFW